MRLAVDVMCVAIENNTSARGRLVDIAVGEEKSYGLSVGTTFADDRRCVPHLESAIAVVLGLVPGQVRIFVTMECWQKKSVGCLPSGAGAFPR
jgi:hypothetical protein